MRDFIEQPVGSEAVSLVTGARQATYGDPIESLTRIGAMWGAVLGIDPIGPREVTYMMICLKVSRDAGGKAHRDNEVDICGYAHLLQMERESHLQPLEEEEDED